MEKLTTPKLVVQSISKLQENIDEKGYRSGNVNSWTLFQNPIIMQVFRYRPEIWSIVGFQCEFGDWGLPASLNVPNETCLFQLPVLAGSLLSLLFQDAPGGLAVLGEGGEAIGRSLLSPSLGPGLLLKASSFTCAALGGRVDPLRPSTASLSLSDKRLCRFCRRSCLLPAVIIRRSRPSFKQQLTSAPIVPPGKWKQMVLNVQ